MSTASPSFAGLKVASFESRRADDMARLIEKLGGVARVSPSLREVPLEKNPAAVDFANRLITGQVDSVIFLTGVGFRYLLSTVERHVDRQRFLNSLADITTIARGPKPVAAMKEVGLTPTLRVPEPNTWREILATIDSKLKIGNQVVGLQEYGLPSPSLVAGLEARGAEVLVVKVYHWDLPENVGPLEENVKAIAAGELDVAMFTSAHQVANLLRVAERLHLVNELRAAMELMAVASIGPTTTEMLRDHDLPVDIVPEHSKMGQLVVEAAEKSAMVLLEKRRRASAPRVSVGDAKIGAGVSIGGAPLAAVDPRAAWYQSPFLRACRGEPNEVTPIWLMRQAGRYLPEYRLLREGVNFLELCKDSDLCTEIMVTTVNRLGVDAAIIFSDLLPILEPMGLQLEFVKGDGPVIHNPIREANDLDRLRELEYPEQLDFVYDTVRKTRAALPPHIPVIGFAGAPFTLASYAIEGGGSRNYLHAKSLMYQDAGVWNAIMERLTRAIVAYLNRQIAAGAQCVQLFDSWVGCLGPDDYRRYVLPHMRRLFDGLTPGVPAIHFGTGNPALLPLYAEGGGHVIGLDWRVRLDDGWRAVGEGKGVQGNLDPLILFADRDEIRRRAREILDQAAGRPGHIFNLGHGVLPQTPVDSVLTLIDAVKTYRR